ncbi:hypothetical protein BT69DRAFT_908560 [Atractiella rhizophila]|nr:hypothetical protein BT69DRAFT_908560 [Atractiella rhizophila]
MVHLITPVTLRRGSLLYLSILDSLCARLPPSIHTLQITFVLPHRFWNVALSKLFPFSLAGLEKEVEPEGTVNLCIVLKEEGIMLTFQDFKHYASMDSDDLDVKPFTCTFQVPDNRSEVIFNPIAQYSKQEQCFIPISNWEESTITSTSMETTIQLSLSSSQNPGINPCTITKLPTEILSLIFEFLSFDQYERLIEGVDNEYLVSFQQLSAVCLLWKAVSVPYLDHNISIKERHARLKQYPHAGRRWMSLFFERRFDDAINTKMAKDVITGSPNVTSVLVDAFWNEEEARVVLHAIEGLTRLDSIGFGGQGLRKWKMDEVENFMHRMGDRIRSFRAYDVEDSASSTSLSLQLSSDLEHLELHTYPPLPSLSLALTLTWLSLSDLCPLPPSISGSCLPPLLEHLEIMLGPYSPAGKISILSTPLGLSHLQHLTRLYLDGGKETSNLVSPQFFHTLRNAKAIATIDVQYCLVHWEFSGFIFSDFICWFFGDRGVKVEGDVMDDVEMVEMITGRRLSVKLFFGAWLEGEMRAL